jgi:tRNA A-37 threonylcarbamoyl transferase component Bud32
MRKRELSRFTQAVIESNGWILELLCTDSSVEYMQKISVQQLCSFRSIKGPHGLRLWYLPDSPVSMEYPKIVQAICCSHSARLPGEIIKTGKRLSVYHVNDCSAPLLIKAFPLKQLKFKLKYKKYALSEICNNLTARQRCISVPSCYAYFEIRPWGLVDNCGVVMEELVEYTAVSVLSQTNKKMLFDVIPVIVRLYQQGVNHVDLSPSNIFMNSETLQYVVIDWQYSSFHAPRDDRQLIFNSAHFLTTSQICRQSDLWSQWLKELQQQSMTKISLDVLEKNVTRLQEMMNNRELDIEDRLTLNLGSLDFS